MAHFRNYRDGTYDNLQTPQTTPDCIIFPYDHQARRFRTSHYNPSQTNHRISSYDIESFLDRINSPVQKWCDYYSYMDKESCEMRCLTSLCYAIPPLGILILFWMCYAKNESIKILQKTIQNARAFVQRSNSKFSRTGFIWNVPEYYPHWIELRANSSSTKSQQAPRGIQTISMPQKYYQMNRVVPQQSYEDNTPDIP